MSETYQSGNPNQQGLPLLSVQDRLPEDDPVYLILDTVTELDISAITAKYEQEERGFTPYPPRMMVALLFYSYCRGVFSSRKIMQACQARLTFRAIVGDHIPRWRAISDFRKLHVKELEGLFVRILKFCQRAGLVKFVNPVRHESGVPNRRTCRIDGLGYIALDSAKVKANAKRHKEMSYGQIKEEEQRLQQEIHRLLNEAEAVDQQEDQQYGTDFQGEELPEQLARRQSRLERIRQAKRALEAEASGEEDRIGKRMTILDIPADGEIRPPTWDESARKCIEVYWEAISRYKNRSR
jgi:transposase